MDWTDTMIYNCFVFENYKQLQLGNSSIFLMVDWKSHQKNLTNSKLGKVFLKVSEAGIKQIFQQRVSF